MNFMLLKTEESLDALPTIDAIEEGFFVANSCMTVIMSVRGLRKVRWRAGLSSSVMSMKKDTAEIIDITQLDNKIPKLYTKI